MKQARLMTQATSSVTAALPSPICAAIRALRFERQETGAQFGEAIGLSKSRVSLLETGSYSPSVAVALRIEQLSGGRIDAAELCEDVRLARHGLPDSAEMEQSSTGQNNSLSGEADAPAPLGAASTGERFSPPVPLAGGGALSADPVSLATSHASAARAGEASARVGLPGGSDLAGGMA